MSELTKDEVIALRCLLQRRKNLPWFPERYHQRGRMALLLGGAVALGGVLLGHYDIALEGAIPGFWAWTKTYTGYSPNSPLFIHEIIGLRKSLRPETIDRLLAMVADQDGVLQFCHVQRLLDSHDDMEGMAQLKHIRAMQQQAFITQIDRPVLPAPSK